MNTVDPYLCPHEILVLLKQLVDDDLLREDHGLLRVHVRRRLLPHIPQGEELAHQAPGVALIRQLQADLEVMETNKNCRTNKNQFIIATKKPPYL